MAPQVHLSVDEGEAKRGIEEFEPHPASTFSVEDRVDRRPPVEAQRPHQVSTHSLELPASRPDAGISDAEERTVERSSSPHTHRKHSKVTSLIGRLRHKERDRKDTRGWKSPSGEQQSAVCAGAAVHP